MRMLTRLAVVLIAAVPATLAFGQAMDDRARLHLVLDPDGRVRLSTSPLDGYGAPPLQQPPLPRLNPHGQSARPGGPSLRLDVRASGDEQGPIPCLDRDVIRLAPFGACDPAGYGGLPGSVSGADVGLQFESGGGRLGLRLNYGLHWLDPVGPDGLIDRMIAGAPSIASGGTIMSGSLLFPSPLGPALGPTPLRSERFGFGSFVPLGGGIQLDLGYQHSRGLNHDFQPGLAPWLLSSQDSVSLGLSYGRFQGGLIGRQQRPLDPLHGGSGSESLDLGFSWRMPWWNAELEFGARNLIVRPAKPEGADRPLEQGDLRTPYLRYHQEL